MGIVLKVISIVLAVVLAVGIVGTIVGVGVGIGRYMVNQNFDVQAAFAWGWKDYTDWLRKVVPFANAENVETWEFTNKNVNLSGPNL